MLLDPENPRLAEYGVHGSGQSELLEALWELSDAAEVAKSIAHAGFYEHEPILVEKKGERYIVIEGNRRLTAVRVLVSATLRSKLGVKNLPILSDNEKQKLQYIPSVITTRKDCWRYLGFKHVNGPATWGSYAKARYVANVHNDYGISLSDIADQIGDNNATVERLYHGLMVVEQAEEWGIFDRSNVHRRTFHFSHIYVGLGYENMRNFLGLSTSDRIKRKPVKPKKKKELGELLLWIYGDRKLGVEPQVKSQNPHLRVLDQALGSPKGVKALRDELPLALAKDAADGENVLLERAVAQAKMNLQRAEGYFSVGFSPDNDDLIQNISKIFRLSKSLHSRVRIAIDGGNS